MIRQLNNLPSIDQQIGNKTDAESNPTGQQQPVAMNITPTITGRANRKT